MDEIAAALDAARQAGIAEPPPGLAVAPERVRLDELKPSRRLVAAR